MKYYIDITLLTGAEIGLGFLWQKVYQQVHLALVENKTADNTSKIAVSFPNYNDKEFPLGNKLRLFSPTKKILQQLDISKWLKRLTDYTHCTSIREVPSSVEQFACFKRKQFKSSSRISADIERRAKYLANKKGRELTEVKAELLELTKKYVDKSNLPFINVVSLSSRPNVSLLEKDRFLLFIEIQNMEAEIKGDFTCYGLSNRDLSKQATVPWF